MKNRLLKTRTRLGKKLTGMQKGWKDLSSSVSAGHISSMMVTTTAALNLLEIAMMATDNKRKADMLAHQFPGFIWIFTKKGLGRQSF